MAVGTQQRVERVVIVGGGAAGWLTAGLLAAHHNVDQGQLAPKPKLHITLIESPEVATIGVGEGTWPSMRQTLNTLGISETEFLLRCDASFKQGSEFRQWRSESAQPDRYLHPFTLPVGQPEFDIAPHWLPHRQQVSFAEAVCGQGPVADAHLAPKTLATPQYHFQFNYGYHLDAGKFSQLLKEHCTERLGVHFVCDHVERVCPDDQGGIQAVVTRQRGPIEGDLFIDCTGIRSLLLGQQLKVPFIEQRSVLFNDRALAVQLPYERPDAPIASCTLSTAHEAGWVWDIGLPTRRGVGVVYSAAHSDEAAAEAVLRRYLGREVSDARTIAFNPGHRAVCWQGNCVAIGMAAGFIEPLEASALAMIEQTATLVAEQLPPTRATMATVAARVNRRYRLHWQQIIEFLKLHYVISQRELSDYWRDHRDAASVPESLQALLALWRHQAPSESDIEYKRPLFPAASYQYVLYGMGFVTEPPAQRKPSHQRQAHQLFEQNRQRTEALMRTLPTNRALLEKVQEFGFSKI
ncbi:tryptophan halogenase family protein [Ferrimonas balearica]|uniref:tryptophan halogenase family protein n=1 Tax=Ferrimonas balearica TaxID=44012 RepID=UPI001C99B0D0|nr:tryptophan halogenase family protein [Ferrimonas balearica]MBY5993981.1 tryptophan 7-halogenase [Ferrimonas balearica]